MANGDMWTLQIVTTESNMNYLYNLWFFTDSNSESSSLSSQKVPVLIFIVSSIVAILLIIGNWFILTNQVK